MKKLMSKKDISNLKALTWLLKCTKAYRLSIFILVVLNIAVTLSTVFVAIVSRSIIDSAVEKSANQAIKGIVIMGVLMIFQMLANSLVSFKTIQVRELMRNKLQLNFIKQTYNIEWLAINKYKAGDIQTRINSDIRNIIEVWVSILPKVISLIVQLISAFAVLFYFDAVLAIFAFVISPATVVISWFIGKRLKEIQHQFQKAEGAFCSFVYESLQNIVILKVFKSIQYNLNQVIALQKQKLYLEMNRTKFSVLANLVLGIGYRVGFFIAFAFGAFRISLNEITFGTFTAFLQLVGQIQAPIEGLSRTIPQVVSSLASVERILEFELLETESIDVNKSIINMMPSGITLNKVTFGYGQGSQVLKNVSVQIKAGETIALLGTSGEGKTTLIRILLSLLKPQSGEVLMNFGNLSFALSAYMRRYFSYVPQSKSLFSGSIEYNLKLANQEATEEELNKAISASCLNDFMNRLPEGINTVIGERGIGLSEGQAQRLIIARALLHNAPFLILDEATSALDSGTEEKLITNLKYYYPETTIIAITHRTSILRICDSVYSITNGHLTSAYDEKKAVCNA